MKRVIYPWLWLVVSLFFSLPAMAEEMRVVASVKPVHALLSGLMEGTGELHLLANPENPRLDQGRLDETQHRKLAAAKLIVWIGPELESGLVSPLAEGGVSAKVVTLLDLEAIKVLPSRWDENRRDPYIWMDSRNAIILADELAKMLMRMDPGRTHLYRRNMEQVLQQLGRLDRELEYGYRGLKGGIGVLYYDTLQYFEQAYAMKIGAVLVAPGREEIDTEALLRTRLQVAAGDYACLLTEVGLPAKQLEFLVGEAEIGRGELDSMGQRFEAGPTLYLELMRYNTDLIRACLQRNDQSEAIAEERSEEAPLAVPGGGRFILTDHRGGLVTEQDLRGKYQLIYFGYTYCPDICPTSLYTLDQALTLIGDKAGLVQPYFVTVDPERDDVEAIRKYVGYFRHDLIGLTGTPVMIERVAEQYRVRYERVVEESADPELYLMDHTASLYLIAPDGAYITKFAHGITPQQLANKLLEHLP